MKEIDNCSEKNINNDYILFKTLNEDSPFKSKRPKQQISLFDINNNNNKLITDTFEDYFLKLNNEENDFGSIFNQNFQDDKQNLKIANFAFFDEKFDLPLLEKDNSKNKKQGRKKKECKEQGNHNKYTSDNIIRKCKTILINLLFNLINKKIREILAKEKGYISTRKRLMKMRQTQIANSSVQYNQSFLYKTLKDIFSENLSSRCSNYPINHNKDLIKELLNEKDLNRRKFFNDLFNLTFLNCIEHFRGTKSFYCLEGLEKYKQISNKLGGDEDYKDSFLSYIENFEKIIGNKKSRKSKKCKKKIKEL